MKWDDTEYRRAANAAMEYAARYGLTYDEAVRQLAALAK